MSDQGGPLCILADKDTGPFQYENGAVYRWAEDGEHGAGYYRQTNDADAASAPSSQLRQPAGSPAEAHTSAGVVGGQTGATSSQGVTAIRTARAARGPRGQHAPSPLPGLPASDKQGSIAAAGVGAGGRPGVTQPRATRLESSSDPPAPAPTPASPSLLVPPTSATQPQRLPDVSPASASSAPAFSGGRLGMSAVEVARRAHMRALSREPLGVEARRRKRWSEEEVAKLRQGVQKHGVGSWAQIFEGTPFPGRTAMDLKDKWRNLNK